jgi:lipid-A-disaccharide synthase
MRNLLIIAAENSAETYGAQVVEEFQRQGKDVHFFGVGGDTFLRQGVELICHNRELAVVGIIEVLAHLFKLKKIMKQLLETAKRKKAEAAILIDYPDFNLRLAKKLKRAGIPVYYYISPTVWAWRYSRVNLIRKFTDHLFIIFPFEIAIYTREKIPFTYTGHPLIPLIKSDETKEETKRRLAVAADEKIISLLPGSRKSEISFLLPRMVLAMNRLAKTNNIKVFIIKANTIAREQISSYLHHAEFPVEVLDQSEGYNLINASEAALTTCGTSNLEIALLGVPFLAVYQVNRLSYLLGKRFVKISLYSIVNILAEAQVIPELIQNNYTADNIQREMEILLNDPQTRRKMKEQFAAIGKKLVQDQNPAEMIQQKICADLEF